MNKIREDSDDKSDFSSSDFSSEEKSMSYFNIQQENERLKKEIESYQKQFQEFMDMSNKLQEQHNRCLELGQQLRAVNMEKEDIQNRLNITLKTNQELKEKLQKEKDSKKIEKQQHLTAVQSDNSKYEKEISELKKQQSSDQAQISSLKSQLKMEKSQSDELKSSIDSFVKSINSICKASFNSLTDALNFITQSQIKSQEKAKDFEILKAQLRKLKKKIKDEKRSHIKQIRLINDEVNGQNENANAKIKDLESKLFKMQIQLEEQEKQYENEINNKDKIIKNIQEKMEKEKEEYRRSKSNLESQELNDFKDQIESQTSKLQEMQKINSNLRRENVTLNSKIYEYTSTVETLKKSLQKAEDIYKSLSKECDDLKSQQITMQLENDRLQELCNSNRFEMESMKSSIHQSEIDINEYESQISKLKSSITILENLINNNQNEIRFLYSEREKNFDLLHKQNFLLKSFDAYSSKIQEESLKQIKKELSEDQNKRSISESIPITAWCTTEFPSSLCAQITEIAKDDDIPIVTKLRHVLTTIARNYSKLIEANSKDKDKMIKELERKVQNSLNLANDLTNLVDHPLFTPEELISDYSKCALIVKNFSDMKADLFDKENEIKNLNDNLFNVFTHLNANNITEAIDLIDKLKESLDKQSKQIDHFISQIKKFKKNHKSFRNSCIQQQNEIEEMVSKQQNTINEFEEEKIELKNQLQRLQIVNSELKRKIEEITKESTQKEITVKQNQEKEMNERTQKFNNEIDKKTQKIISLSERIKKIENETNQWKKSTEVLKKSVQEKDKMIDKLTEQIKENEKNYLQKISNEKTNIKLQYEKVLSQNKSKNEEMHQMLLKLTKSHEDFQNKNKTLISSNTHLSIENQQNKARIESLKQENERYQKLMETKFKAAELSKEMEKQNAIEELKGNFESNKRAIFAYIANEFRQYFNVEKGLDENNFKELVNRVGTELKRLSKQESNLRKILGITSADSIEKIVSNLLVTMFNNH